MFRTCKMQTSSNLTPKKKKKKFELNLLLSEIKAGSNPAKISKKYNIPKSSLSYSLGKLKKMGCIKKVGYGSWEFIEGLKQVRIRPKGSREVKFEPLKKEIRGHAFIWNIQFESSYDWETIVNNYKKTILAFQRICQGKVLRTIYQARKIWLTKKGLTIYEPIDFFGKSSWEVKGSAVFNMDRVVKGLIAELGQKMRRYKFTTSREHYGMIKNELARQYNDKKEKMNIRGEDGTIWLWIDDSKALGELETADPLNSRGVQTFWNSQKKHKFKVDADFVLLGFEQQTQAITANAKNLSNYAEHLKAHVQSVKDLGAGVKEYNKEVEKQNKILKKITKLLEKQ